MWIYLLLIALFAYSIHKEPRIGYTAAIAAITIYLHDPVIAVIGLIVFWMSTLPEN